MTENLIQKAERLQRDFAEDRDLAKGRAAADAWCEVLAVDMDNPIAMANLGAVLQEIGMPGLAACVYNRALAIEHRIPDAWSNLGGLYRNSAQLERAESCFYQALSICKDRPVPYLNNLITCYINSGRPEEGLVLVDEALEREPLNHHLNWNKGLLLLESGQYEEGFRLYEDGLNLDERIRRDYGTEIQMWDGSPISDGSLVVYGEQGLGDEIMYASAIEDALKLCPKIILDCHPRLLSMFRRSFPQIEFLYPTRKKSTINWLTNHHDIKARCAIGSLFYHFRRSGKFPKRPYLRVQEGLVEKKKERLQKLSGWPVIGISWVGGTLRTNKPGRSVRLSDMKPLFDAFPKALFLSFQYTPEAAEKVARHREHAGVNIYHLDEAYMEDYMHTAAMAQCCDFIVSPNTTLVHLCGSLGVECHTFTPQQKAWRYYGNGDESDMIFYGPWIRQYHQRDDEPRLSDVVVRIVERLKLRGEKAQVLEMPVAR